MEINSVATTKAAVSGGLSTLLVATINDAEMMALLLTGMFASLTSFFYDWVHRDPRELGLRELSELMKHLFYGIAVMFIIFSVGVELGNSYIELPNTSWGFISALCAGSAVSIVEWTSSIIKKITIRRVEK